MKKLPWKYCDCGCKAYVIEIKVDDCFEQVMSLYTNIQTMYLTIGNAELQYPNTKSGEIRMEARGRRHLEGLLENAKANIRELKGILK